MSIRTLTIAVITTLGVASAPLAVAQGRHDDRPHGWTAATAPTTPAKVPEGGIALKEGGTLLIGRNGVTYHMDAGGHRVRMRDGQSMEAMDGATYVMKNDAVWRSITEKGTLHPTHQ